MNSELENLNVDLDELERDVERNRRDRLKFIDLQARWVRDHCMKD